MRKMTICKIPNLRQPCWLHALVQCLCHIRFETNLFVKRGSMTICLEETGSIHTVNEKLITIWMHLRHNTPAEVPWHQLRFFFWHSDRKLQKQSMWTPLFMSNSQFTFPRLFMDMQQYQGSMLMIYDEIASPYKQVEKTTQKADWKTFLALHGSSEWTCTIKPTGANTICHSHTHLNYTGFLEPKLIITLFNQYDLDGFNDQHWICLCADPPNVLLGEMAIDGDPIDLRGFLMTIYQFFHP